MPARLIGFVLLAVGIVFLGQNVIFSSNAFSIFPFRWQTIPAGGCLVGLLCGMAGLIFGGKGYLGASIASLIAGALFGFFAGVIRVMPTSLAEVFIGICLMVLGARVMIDGNLNVF
jgi:hypothetical protein